MPDASDRRLAAILFSDVVGYTSLMAADEERGRDAHPLPVTAPPCGGPPAGRVGER